MSWQAIAAAVALVGAGVTAYGQIQAGRRAAGTAAQNAELELLNRELMDIEAQQASLDRLNQYEIDSSTNKAMFSALGRLDDPSMQAFFKSQDEIIGKDLGRIRKQTEIEMGNVSIRAAALRAKSKNLLKSATVEAFGTLLQGASTYASSRRATPRRTQSTPPPRRGQQPRRTLLRRLYDNRGN